MDKRALLIFGLLAVLLIIIFLRSQQQHTSEPATIVRVGNHTYSAEIADTLISQARGLSGRPSLAQETGMLFVFATSSVQSFWMQGMQFPLDFVWINNGKVIGVTENVPNTSPLAMYPSPSLVNMVLELNAGVVAQDGIKIGDEVRIKNDK